MPFIAVNKWVAILVCAWTLPLVAFLAFLPALLRRRGWLICAAVLCFSPAMAFYRPFFDFMPLVVAIPSWFIPIPIGVGVLTGSLSALPTGVVIMTIAHALTAKATRVGGDTTDTIPSPISPSGLRATYDRLVGRRADRRSRIYAGTLLLVLPMLVVMTGFYPWRASPPAISMPEPLGAALIFLCAARAHMLTSAVMGPITGTTALWKRLGVAIMMFMLLRSFVAAFVTGVFDPAHHFGFGG